MEFHVKLQELRKQNNLTQEQLAQKLFVSRTAISKWESNRGYPSIESLKNLSKLFSISLDDLLSSEELLFITEENNSAKISSIINLIFGLMDISVILLVFLPFFALRQETLYDVSLVNLNGVSFYIKLVFYAFVIFTSLLGLITISLQNFKNIIWLKTKTKLSLILSVFGTLIFTLCLQPYAAVYVFVFLIIKIILLTKISRHE